MSREYEILSKIKTCEYVVKLLNIFYTINDEGNIVQNLVMEYVGKDLENYIKEFKEKSEKIPMEKIKKITKQSLLGLDF